jgi:hypothetical protein
LPWLASYKSLNLRNAGLLWLASFKSLNFFQASLFRRYHSRVPERCKYWQKGKGTRFFRYPTTRYFIGEAVAAVAAGWTTVLQQKLRWMGQTFGKVEYIMPFELQYISTYAPAHLAR